MTTVYSMINSDQTHTDSHGITSREVTNVDAAHLDNIACELRGGGWEKVEIKTGIYKAQPYWILTAIKYPALTSQL